MRYAAALSTHPDARTAIGEVIGDVMEQVGPSPDLAVLMFTGPHLAAAGLLATAVDRLLSPGALVGASASAIIGGATGVEDRAGVVLWAGNLGRPATAFHLDAQVEGGAVRISGLEPTAVAASGSMLLLADPFSFPAGDFLAGMASDHPTVAVIGGLASAGRRPGENALVFNGTTVNSGAVGVLLEADHSPGTVVSQGCRPIGVPYTVTKSEQNLVLELGGRPALERLQEIIAALSPEDRELASQGLHCGIVANEHQLDFGRGDFLIRGVLGADRSTGAVAVGDTVEIGSTVQFQVRDPATAGEDLRSLLTNHRGQAALVFTCNGRGTFMFGDPHHDAAIVEDHLGHAPIAGMFCAGEFGPVAGRNALHGFTASVALFS